jgi:hypothetical protein
MLEMVMTEVPYILVPLQQKRYYGDESVGLCLIHNTSLFLRQKHSLNELAGRKQIEDALQRLDNLTQEETRVTMATNLEVKRKDLAITERQKGAQTCSVICGLHTNIFSGHAAKQAADRPYGSLFPTSPTCPIIC